MFFNIIPVATEHQKMHPYSVVNIDITKMMREWPIFKQARMGSCKAMPQAKRHHQDSRVLWMQDLIQITRVGPADKKLGETIMMS